MSEITVFDVTSSIKITHPNLNTIIMNVVMSKECEKFKAHFKCPVPECTLKVMKNGFASRYGCYSILKNT
jgi:hypothetical protein